MPDNFSTTYSALISEYDARITVVKQEIRDLMADPVGAGMTARAFAELIKDTSSSTADRAVGYGTSDPAVIVSIKCDIIDRLEKAKAICAELDAE